MTKEDLAPLIGTWEVRSPAFPDAPEALMTFEWVLDGRYVMQRGDIAVPGAPTSLSLIEPAGDGFTMHYFDTRGVTRLYAMTFDGREWTLTRDSADFSGLSFRQRWAATVSADAIQGRWERTDGPSGDWLLDFELTYRRV